MQRRSLTAALATLTGWPLALRAQAGWPARQIRLVVGFPPGGGIDFTASTLQRGLEAALGQTVVIDHKPGAGGMLAATEVMRAAPDGYTLLLANTGPFAIAPQLPGKRPVAPLRQFSPLGQITETAYIAATRADHPAKDLKQFVAWARANPGQASFASAGPGSSTHLNGALLNALAGTDLLHVPYTGSAPALHDLIGGQTQLMIDAGTVLLPQIQRGRLKALAVTGARRHPLLPDVPTVRELGLPGLEAVGFQGLVGPAGLPREVVDRLCAALHKLLTQPDIQARFAAAGALVQPRDAADFAAHVKATGEKWAALIRQRRIGPV